MEQQPLKRKDTLKLQGSNDLKRALKKGEKVFWSGDIIKINKRKRSQKRRFILTNMRLINLGDTKFFDSLVGFFAGSKIKRQISLEDITHLTYSEYSNEFILHVPSTYDYRLRASSNRDEFIFYLLHLRQKLKNSSPVKIWLRMEIELGKFTKTDDMKFNVFPPGEPSQMAAEQFQAYYKEKNLKHIEELKNTETLISRDGKQLTEQDFEVIRVLGRGAFGKVILTQKKDDEELYAVKIMNKADLIERNQIEQIKTEKDILEQVRHPFLVCLEYCFHSPSRIYFAMKFMQGGELFQHLKKFKRFNEKNTKFYAAQILLALEHLHSLDIIYRDLKPENILLDSNGYIKLADFGVSKKLKRGVKKTNTIVGTPEYVPPEIITQKGHGKEADWWSFGIFVYEMLVGIPPFYSKNQHTMLCQIIKEKFKFPNGISISTEARDLINGLLTKNPEERLGHNGDAEEIRNHPWFADVDFEAITAFTVTPPIMPELKDKFDVAYFDNTFTKEDPRYTRRDSTELLLIENFNHEFNEFNYEREDKEPKLASHPGEPKVAGKEQPPVDKPAPPTDSTA